jgi:hypothetical protein
MSTVPERGFLPIGGPSDTISTTLGGCRFARDHSDDVSTDWIYFPA